MMIKTGGIFVAGTGVLATVLGVSMLVLVLFGEAQAQQSKSNPSPSKAKTENDKARPPADFRAQDLSIDKQVVGIGIVIGKDSAATGQQVGQALKDALLTQGIPSEFQVDTVAGKGVIINFFIDGHAHIDPPNHPDGDYNTKAAFGQIYAVAAAFKKKFPDAVVKPVVRTVPQSN
jgi:hypothetical protein